jgi:hypothetical protein
MDEGLDKAPRRKRVSRACDRCRSKKVSRMRLSLLPSFALINALYS